jgi:hypothetical protein
MQGPAATPGFLRFRAAGNCGDRVADAEAADESSAEDPGGA